MSVSIPSGISGDYEDTSDSDSVDSGDLLDYGIIGAPLAGSGSFRMDWIGAHFVADDPNLCMIGGSQGGAQLISSFATKYSSLFGGGSVAMSGDGGTFRATGKVPYAATATKLTNYLTQASQTPTAGAATFTLLVNGTASSLTVSSTAGQSGYWTDSTHSVSIDVGDICANRIEVTAGDVAWASAALLLEAT